MKTTLSILMLASVAGTASAQCGQFTKWRHFDPQAGDHFGQSLSSWGTVAAVGAPQDDFNGATNSGTFFIYERTNGAWSWRFAAQDTVAAEAFGRSVATDGTLVGVGDASGPVLNNLARGGGTIYKKISGNWSSISVPMGGVNAGDDFGFSAAAGGGRVAFGAPRHDFNAGDDMGAVFVYRVDANNAAQLMTTVVHPAASSQAGEHFGYSVAIAPSGGPNPGMLVVGAPDRDNGQTTSTGGIYVFNPTGQGYQLQNLPTQWDELFQFNGLAVATNGENIMSGAPSWGNARGRVFLYARLPGGNWEVYGFLSGPDGDGGNFGSSITMNGDYAAISAPGFDKVYIYHASAGGWALVRTLNAASQQGSTTWGSSVAINAGSLMVGDPGDTADAFTGAGSVSVTPLASMAGADDAEDADEIVLPASVSGCLEGANPTYNGLPGMCGSSSTAPDVFFAFVAPRSGEVVADTIGSGFDTVLSAHDAAPDWQDASLITCNDDINGSQNRQSRVTFTATAGHVYWLRVAGFNGATGAFELHARYNCRADFNEDGFLDFFDYDDFVNCFETGSCPPGKTADMTGDAFVDFFDYDAFVTAFERGC